MIYGVWHYNIAEDGNPRFFSDFMPSPASVYLTFSELFITEKRGSVLDLVINF